MKNNLKDGFEQVAEKLDVQALISVVTSADTTPQDVDAAMLAASNNRPFYPADKELTGFLLKAKSDPVLDAKLFAAGAISAPAREYALAIDRVSDKQGAFTNFIYADAENPLSSRVYKVVRAPQVGAGNGAWGGLKEGEDVNVSVTVNREVYEEVIDAVKLVIKIEGGNSDLLEQAFDKAMKDAFDQKKQPAEGVEAFMATLGNVPVLQSRLRGFVDLANDLISDLVATEKVKLFQCRDDAHAIERGWGFKVDAFAHVAGISKETAEKFDRFCETVEGLKQEVRALGLSTIAGEMQGIAVYTLADAPKEITKNFYGHEGLAEIIGFVRLLEDKQADVSSEAIWSDFVSTGAVSELAKKMRLQDDHLRDICGALVNAAPSDGYLVVEAKAYGETLMRKSRALGADLTR